MAEFILTEHERASLAFLHQHGTPVQSRRAQIVLLSAEGVPVSAIMETVSASKSLVYRLRRDWRNERLGMFPPDEAAPVAAETPVSAVEVLPDVVEPRLPLELRRSVGMLPDDPMAEAGRKVLFYHFERMLLNEPGSRQGVDIEAVHDMRVATRRMRSAFGLFRPFFKRRAIKQVERGLRDLGRLLGDVRDLDVMMDNAQRFISSHPGTNLDPLFAIWQKRLVKSRRALMRELDSKSFARLIDHFHGFLISPGAGARAVADPGEAAGFLVRHVAPRLIYEHFEQVRAYDTLLDDAPLSTLHALRIDFKRFRYTLEFFEEVLGPEIKSVIKETKIMQDHLGELQDTEVVGNVLGELIDHYKAKYSGVPVFMRPDMSGVAVYALSMDDEQRRLLDRLPAAWANFNRDEVRRNLALAVAVL